MSNLHLFALINAPSGLGGWQVALAVALAQWLIYLLPPVLLVAWWRADAAARGELLQMLLAVGIGLALGQLVAHVWPEPRPFALHLGTQYLAHTNDPGLPSDHVTVLWSLALGALATRRYATWCFPLLTCGLVVGWSRVYLGVHFPYDVLAALPIAVVAATVARLLREPLEPFFAALIGLYHRLETIASRRRARLQREHGGHQT